MSERRLNALVDKRVYDFQEKFKLAQNQAEREDVTIDFVMELGKKVLVEREFEVIKRKEETKELSPKEPLSVERQNEKYTFF